MTRMNNHIREQVLKNAIATSPIPTRILQLDQRRIDFIEACRIESLGGAVKAKKIEKLEVKIKEMIDNAEVPKSMRDGIFKPFYRIDLNIAGAAVKGYFGIGYTYPDSGITFKKLSAENLTILGGSELHEEFLGIENEVAAIVSSKEELRISVNAVLWSVNSVEKLLEIWPEVSELLPAELSPYKGTTLPAVLPAKLNEMIGLPTEKVV